MAAKARYSISIIILAIGCHFTAAGAQNTDTATISKCGKALIDVKVVSLAGVSKADAPRIHKQIIKLANDLYEADEKQGKEGIFPIDPYQMQLYSAKDSRSQLSQVALDQDGNVVGFAVAFPIALTSREGAEIPAVNLEKLGVSPDYQGIGLSSLLVNKLAARGHENKIPMMYLLVRIGNRNAQDVYEHWGLQNTTPPELRQRVADSGGNAFAFVGPIATILERTRPGR